MAQKKFKQSIPRASVYAHLEKCKEDKIFADWTKTSKSARDKTYQYGLAEFLTFHGKMTPTELYNLRRLDADKHTQKAKQMIYEYREYLMKYAARIDGKFLSPKTQNGRDCVVRSFFSKACMYQVVIENMDDAQVTLTENYAIDLETIGKMVDVCDTVEKATIYLLCQTGVSGDLTKINKQTGRPVIEYSENVHKQFEAWEAADRPSDWVIIIPYLRTKFKQGGKRTTALCGEGVFAYAAYKTKKNIVVGDPMLIGHKHHPMSEKQMREIVKHVVAKAGIDTGETRLGPHTLRAFLFTNVVNAANELRAKWITGKKIPPELAVYLTKDEVMNLYKYKLMERLNPNQQRMARTATLEEELESMGERITKLEGMIEKFLTAFNPGGNGDTPTGA